MICGNQQIQHDKSRMDEKNIEIAGLCTKCCNDLFFSHRGQKGKRGLMAGVIMMK